MADQWKAVDVWQHMYAAVEDQNGVEVARVYRPDRLLIAEQIAQAYNAQAERAALIEENERYQTVLEHLLDYSEMPSWQYAKKYPNDGRDRRTIIRNALTPTRPGDVRAGAECNGACTLSVSLYDAACPVHGAAAMKRALQEPATDAR